MKNLFKILIASSCLTAATLLAQNIPPVGPGYRADIQVDRFPGVPGGTNNYVNTNLTLRIVATNSWVPLPINKDAAITVVVTNAPGAGTAIYGFDVSPYNTNFSTLVGNSTSNSFLTFSNTFVGADLSNTVVLRFPLDRTNYIGEAMLQFSYAKISYATNSAGTNFLSLDRILLSYPKADLYKN